MGAAGAGRQPCGRVEQLADGLRVEGDGVAHGDGLAVDGLAPGRQPVEVGQAGVQPRPQARVAAGEASPGRARAERLHRPVDARPCGQHARPAGGGPVAGQPGGGQVPLAAELVRERGRAEGHRRRPLLPARLHAVAEFAGDAQ